MNSPRSIVLFVLILSPFVVRAQTETFDISTFQPPQGWKKQVTDYAVSYSSVDQVLGSWVQLGVYKSVASSGNPAADFSSEWKALVKQDTYAGAVEPKPETVVRNGWTINAGASYFTWEKKKSTIMLTNFSGFGTMVSVVISTNSDKYMKDVENFFSTLQLKAPEEQQQVQQPQQQAQPTQEANAAPVRISDAPGTQGISLSTTNFDDGWVAQPFADYVRVTKQPVTVLLHYPVQINDEMRQASNMAAYFWNTYITPRYRTSNLREFQNEPYTYNKVYFYEGDAVELSTGKTVYVGLRVLVWSGVARPIEIIAPSASALQKEFADQAKIEAMPNYNKFAVAPQDIIGTWEESSSTGIDMYNTVTGSYAGMNTTASADSFVFGTGDTYNSNHKGAYGMVGNMTFYDQKYHGKYTLTPWDVTMTNRFEGKTDVFWCQFEAVRGGRKLRLQDKVATAMIYELVKTK